MFWTMDGHPFGQTYVKNASSVLRTGRIAQVALLLLLPFLTVCGVKTKALKAPAASLPNAEFDRYISEGDRHFAKAHLYGWRQAETFYTKAYELKQTETLRDKLLLTLFLIVTREYDEDIFDPEIYDKIKPLCASATSPRHRLLCTLAQRYEAGRVGEEPDEPLRIDPALFDLQHSALQAYLYLTLVQTYNAEEYLARKEEFTQRFAGSPLFAYVNLEKSNPAALTDLEESHPEFAELFVFRGNKLFYNVRFQSAVDCFQTTQHLIPDYTKALNGLGNIAFFTLHDYEKALTFYDRALQWDPGNLAAWFGQGAVLHHLGRYGESNSVLDGLPTQAAVRGRSPQDVNYYAGEAYYYQAYNHLLLDHRAKARERVDIARQYLPDSGSINYLSGLLHLGEGKVEEAEADFMRALAKGPNCNARYYIGVIQHARTDGKFLDYFLGAAGCLETEIRGLEKELAAVSSMDLDDAEKQALRSRLQERVTAQQAAAKAQIRDMLQKTEQSEAARKELYEKLLGEILARISSRHLIDRRP